MKNIRRTELQKGIFCNIQHFMFFVFNKKNEIWSAIHLLIWIWPNNVDPNGSATLWEEVNNLSMLGTCWDQEFHVPSLLERHMRSHTQVQKKHPIVGTVDFYKSRISILWQSNLDFPRPMLLFISCVFCYFLLCWAVITEIMIWFYKMYTDFSS